MRLAIVPLHDPVTTWYKITHVGTQVAQLGFKNKAGQLGLVQLALLKKSHCITCVPACVTLYHVTGSCIGSLTRL